MSIIRLRKKDDKTVWYLSQFVGWLCAMAEFNASNVVGSETKGVVVYDVGADQEILDKALKYLGGTPTI